LAKLHRQFDFSNPLTAKLFIDNDKVFAQRIFDIFDGFVFGGTL